MQQNNLLQAVQTESSLKAINTNLESKHSSIDAKLLQLEAIADQMPFTIEYKLNAQSTFAFSDLTGNKFVRRIFTNIEFDVKPKTVNGILWWVLSVTDTQVISYKN